MKKKHQWGKKYPPLRKQESVITLFIVSKFSSSTSRMNIISAPSPDYVCLKKRETKKNNNWPLGRVTLLVVFFQSIRSIEHLFFYIKIVKKKNYFTQKIHYVFLSEPTSFWESSIQKKWLWGETQTWKGFSFTNIQTQIIILKQNKIFEKNTKMKIINR